GARGSSATSRSPRRSTLCWSAIGWTRWFAARPRRTSPGSAPYAPGVTSAYRRNRLFHPESGRCLAIAVDHGMPGEPDLLEGIEDMDAVVDALVAAHPQALLL